MKFGLPFIKHGTGANYHHRDRNS